MKVVSVDDAGVRLCAPLAPNINHRHTVFGGSASALAILSAWTLVHVRLQGLPFANRIVIQRNAVEYLKPIRGDFCAFCPSPPTADWQRFVGMLTKKAKARIELQADLFSAEERVGTFAGTYVALKRDHHTSER